MKFTGLSTIANPKGEVLLQAAENEVYVGIVTVDIALARDKNITSRNNIFIDRRPKEYSILVNN